MGTCERCDKFFCVRGRRLNDRRFCKRCKFNMWCRDRCLKCKGVVGARGNKLDRSGLCKKCRGLK